MIHAGNGEEALAWCRRRVTDVLVTDIKRPGPVDGRTIAERCREHDPRLPVIYATGFSVYPCGSFSAGREASDDGKPIWIGLG